MSYFIILFENIKKNSAVYFVPLLSKCFTIWNLITCLSFSHLLSATTPFNPKFSATVHPLNSYQSFPQIGVNQKTSKRKPDLFKFVCVIDVQLRKRRGWVVFPLILTKIFMACIYFETLFILLRPQSHRPCFNICRHFRDVY